MLLRLELTELLQRLTSEEHELAASLRTVLRVRDQERNAMANKLHAANMRALAAEKRLERYKKRHADDNDDDDDDDPDYYDGDLADDELLQRYADSVQSGSEHASCTPTVTGTEAGDSLMQQLAQRLANERFAYASAAQSDSSVSSQNPAVLLDDGTPFAFDHTG